MSLVLQSALILAFMLLRADGDSTSSCTCDGYFKGTDNTETIVISSSIPDSIDCSMTDECSKKCSKWAETGTNGGNLCTEKHNESLGNIFCGKIPGNVTEVKLLLRHTLCGTKGDTNADFVQPISCTSGKFTGQCKQ